MSITMWILVVVSVILVWDVGSSMGNTWKIQSLGQASHTNGGCMHKTSMCDAADEECDGILTSFAVILSSVVSNPVNVSTLSSEGLELTSTTTTILETTTDTPIFQLMDLPFAQRLINPCEWDSELDTASRERLEAIRVKFVKEFYIFVSHYARLYKDVVGTILHNHTIADCNMLAVLNLPHTPTLAELQEGNIETASNKIYLSLLVHSAYSYFIHHQFVTKLRCQDNIEEERILANKTLNLALKQKALACYVRVGMVILGYKQGDILPLLDAKISDLSQCSRRALRDCQVMKSMYNFLGDLAEYYEGELARLSATSDSVTSDYATTAIGDGQ